MRPTGPLHLGHLVGALENWKQLQAEHDCFFMVADWHALMSEYEHPQEIQRWSLEMVADWIACGIDPQRSVIFRQSDVPEHLELAMVLSILTPLGWVERVPTYKEQLREVKGRDLTTYGFLGYPILQAADILLYQAEVVPVGEDQVSHLELARELVRRFASLYGTAPFPEPQAKLTQSPRLMGLDARKMSKSYDNVINLSDEPDSIRKKVQSMFTDPQRIKRTDFGHPETCNLCAYYPVFAPDRATRVWDECRTAKRGCVENKQELADVLIEVTEPIRRKRTELLQDRHRLEQLLSEGASRARSKAQETMGAVKRLVKLA